MNKLEIPVDGFGSNVTLEHESKTLVLTDKPNIGKNIGSGFMESTLLGKEKLEFSEKDNNIYVYIKSSARPNFVDKI